MDDIESFSVAGLVAPHPSATAAGRDVLIEGGTVIEAALAAAAVGAIVVPHSNGLGGDALWMIREPGPRGRVRVLDARGTVGSTARLSFFRDRDHETVPLHGPEAVLTVPGAVAGWAEAHALSRASGGRLPLSRLLAPAIVAARDGDVLAAPDVAVLSNAAPGLRDVPGFTAAFLHDGKAPEAGTRRRNPALAATLDYLVAAGLDDFYRGDVGRELAADLEALSCPLARADLRAAEARWREPHVLDLDRHVLTVPPTRSGLWAAVCLGLVDALGTAGFNMSKADGFARWHGLIEASRAADDLLDAAEADASDPAALLEARDLARAALTLNRVRARRADPPRAPLLTEHAVWIGAVDRDGAAVSLVQTLGGAFGSGVVSRRTGILVGNRGAALAIDPDLGPVVRPGRRPPLRSLPVLLAAPRDGRVASLGATGQQAAALAAQLSDRFMRGMSPEEALAAPRFALCSTPEGREAAVLVEETNDPGPETPLKSAGHQIVQNGGADMRTVGLAVRMETGRIATASDAGEAAGL